MGQSASVRMDIGYDPNISYAMPTGLTEGSFPSYFITQTQSVGIVQAPTNVNNPPPVYPSSSSSDHYIKRIEVSAGANKGIMGIRWIDAGSGTTASMGQMGQVTQSADFDSTERITMCVIYVKRLNLNSNTQFGFIPWLVYIHGMNLTTENKRNIHFGETDLTDTQAFPIVLDRVRLVGFYGSSFPSDQLPCLHKLGLYVAHDIGELKISNVSYKLPDQMPQSKANTIRKVEYKNDTSYPQTICLCEKINHTEKMKWDGIWQLSDKSKISVYAGVPVVGFKDPASRTLQITPDTNYSYTRNTIVNSSTSMPFPISLAVTPRSNTNATIGCDSIDLNVPFTCSVTVKYNGIDSSTSCDKVGGVFQGKCNYNCQSTIQ